MSNTYNNIYKNNFIYTIIRFIIATARNRLFDVLIKLNEKCDYINNHNHNISDNND